MTTKLPSLRSLSFSFIGKNEISFIFGTLRVSNMVCFQDTIINIEFKFYEQFNNHELETLVLDILLSFLHISSLDFLGNDIHSIQPILDRI